MRRESEEEKRLRAHHENVAMWRVLIRYSYIVLFKSMKLRGVMK